jgi:hypothetical protein
VLLCVLLGGVTTREPVRLTYRTTHARAHRAQDDTSIGLDGALANVDASWEGVGRCALGPRTVP